MEQKKTNRQVIADRLGRTSHDQGGLAPGEGTGEGVRPDRGRGVISKDRIIR